VAHETNLYQPFFIEVPVAFQESEWSYVCMLGILILPLFLLFHN